VIPILGRFRAVARPTHPVPRSFRVRLKEGSREPDGTFWGPLSSDVPPLEEKAMSKKALSRSFLKEGLSTGLLGAATVAIWFFLVDVVSGTPFRTPGILGSMVFLGISSADEAVINVTTVGLYSLLHGTVFFLVGIGTTAIIRAADRAPSVLGLFIPLTLVLQALFVGLTAILAQFILGAIAWWAVLGGNLLASFLMGSLLLYWHPVTAKNLRDPEAEHPS